MKDQVEKMGSSDRFYTIEELCKLQRATTEREREAFFWFFGTFLQCVSGRRAWGKGRYKELVSKAREEGGRMKVVTTSDEAFALLLFDNYEDKWLGQKPLGTTAEAATVEFDENADKDGRRKGSRRKGKYTGKKSGHCKYGGWSREGTARFNQLYNLVQADRASPSAERIENELLENCKAQKYVNKTSNDERPGEGDGTAGSAVLELLPVEAFWDLDKE